MNQTTEKILWVLITVMIASATMVIMKRLSNDLTNLVLLKIKTLNSSFTCKEIIQQKGADIIGFITNIFQHFRTIH